MGRVHSVLSGAFSATHENARQRAGLFDVEFRRPRALPSAGGAARRPEPLLAVFRLVLALVFGGAALALVLVDVVAPLGAGAAVRVLAEGHAGGRPDVLREGLALSHGLHTGASRGERVAGLHAGTV